MSKKQLLGIFVAIAAVAAFIKFRQSQAEQLNYKGIKYYQVYSLNKPDTLFFCEERVPADLSHVEEKFGKEMYHYNYLRRKTNIIIKRVNYWFPIIEKILAQHDVPDDFKYLAVVESGLSNAISPKGAAGFWQFIPTTARRMGLTVNEEVDERYDPIKATHAACKYLKTAHRQLGNWTNVAASYNMGVSGIKRQLKVQRKKSYYNLDLNKETGQYVYRIVALKEIIEHQQKYGFNPAKIGFPAHKKIKVKESIPNLAAFAKKQGTSLDDLKEYNPWLVGTALTVNEKRYVLKIPLKKKASTKEQTDAKVVLDSVKPTPFTKDSIKEAVEKAEHTEKSELYLKKVKKDTSRS